MSQTDSLTNEQAITALRLVGQSWLKEDGVTAYGVMADARDYISSRHLEMPEWLVGTPPNPGAMLTDEVAEIGRISREALQIIIDSEDQKAKGWVLSAIQKASEPHAQVVELVLAIKGAMIIGTILAARVKKIDRKGIEFGPPLKGLGTVLAAAKQFFTG